MSSPPRARKAPTVPPIAPAPTTVRSGAMMASVRRGSGERSELGADRFGSLLLGRVQLASIVVVLEQLRVASPIDGGVELSPRLVRAEEAFQRFQQAFLLDRLPLTDLVDLGHDLLDQLHARYRLGAEDLL